MNITEDILEVLVEKLPHGSGINFDYTWVISDSENDVAYISNAFDNMTENGYYDGISPFSVKIRLTDNGFSLEEINFLPEITDPETFEKYSNELLLDYLYETYHNDIESINDVLLEKADILVFVYGTLKRGFYNEFFLKNSEFIESYTANIRYKMVNLGEFPSITPDNKINEISGEIYKINKKTLNRLDEFEGVPSFFNREMMNFNGHGVWVYTMTKNNYPTIKSGVWI